MLRLPDEREIERYAEALIPGRAAARARRVEQGVDAELRARLSTGDLARLATIGSEGREREWAEGRRALFEAHAALVSAGAEEAGILSSISHTHLVGEGAALALAVAPRAGEGAPIWRIGVDLEHAGRKYHPAAERRVILPEERGLELGFLAIWTIKEACYKAGAQPTNSTITKYVIRAWDPARRIGEAFGPGGSVRFTQFESRGWELAIASSLR